MNDNVFLQIDTARETRLDEVDRSFRSEVVRFLDTELTEDLRTAGRTTTGLKSDPASCKAWGRKLYQRGWSAPLWPVEYGGAGWTHSQRLYFENACADRDAPIIHSSGIRTIGPLIISEGTQEQKDTYLPEILTGTHQWCQGFSEPQAGSDLSALALLAEIDGDSFVLTGNKIWTSFAQSATHMFLLARCEAGSRGNKGLVFLLVEMDRPGIGVRPIRFIDGECETNEVHFDHVRTPINDRIGAIGEGWATAKLLMAIARSNNTTTGLLHRALRAAQSDASEDCEIDRALQVRLMELSMRVEAFEMLEKRVGGAGIGVDFASASSALKLIATELHQAITEAALDANNDSPLCLEKYFATRAATIYSGTSEIHRNILAHSLGCP